ncbi:hypothetical protein J1605_008860 [Eschrichtius robustus]|uniref:Uncharacterized protein n=1 Tax=Eschrichtius robustus TaxID=9764 RepID=A0AB34GXX4_ESCRO|nr:hypothetical protein J1605_008860 [Eschrichtius robustus]
MGLVSGSHCVHPESGARLWERSGSEELCQLTHTFFQHVEEWHSVSCNVTSDKENVTVAADVSLSQSEQVLEI